MTIHSTHPFEEPPASRDQVRRLRGRLASAVTLWTAGAGEHERVGLPVTSVMVAAGEPGRVIALLDPDADLTQALLTVGRGVIHLLSWEHRDLAEVFAGLFPAPGGPFRAAAFEQTPAGPRLLDAVTWAQVSVESTQPVGRSTLVITTLDELHVGDDPRPLLHRRGRYETSR